MRRLKVPHILSDSSVASPTQSSFRKPPVVGTPSSSSAWKRRKNRLEEAVLLRELDDEAKARSYLQRRPEKFRAAQEKEADVEVIHRRFGARGGRPPPIWSARASPPPARAGALSLSLSHQQQAPECGTTMQELGQRNQRRPPEDDLTARDPCFRRPRMDQYAYMVLNCFLIGFNSNS